MSEQISDLEWLARKVDKWEHNAISVVKVGDNYAWSTCKVAKQDTPCYTYDQWLSERERLQGKPNWEDAPRWAFFLSQSSSGEWLWLCSKYKKGLPAGNGEFLGRYDCLVEVRPELTENMPKAKPDWIDAPRWAHYLKQESCGTWLWLGHKGIRKKAAGKSDPVDDGCDIEMRSDEDNESHCNCCDCYCCTCYSKKEQELKWSDLYKAFLRLCKKMVKRKMT